jgi:hypothetical protein
MGDLINDVTNSSALGTLRTKLLVVLAKLPEIKVVNAANLLLAFTAKLLGIGQLTCLTINIVFVALSTLKKRK